MEELLSWVSVYLTCFHTWCLRDVSKILKSKLGVRSRCSSKKIQILPSTAFVENFNATAAIQHFRFCDRITVLWKSIFLKFKCYFKKNNNSCFTECWLSDISCLFLHYLASLAGTFFSKMYFSFLTTFRLVEPLSNKSADSTLFISLKVIFLQCLWDLWCCTCLCFSVYFRVSLATC